MSKVTETQLLLLPSSFISMKNDTFSNLIFLVLKQSFTCSSLFFQIACAIVIISCHCYEIFCWSQYDWSCCHLLRKACKSAWSAGNQMTALHQNWKHNTLWISLLTQSNFSVTVLLGDLSTYPSPHPSFHPSIHSSIQLSSYTYTNWLAYLFPEISQSSHYCHFGLENYLWWWWVFSVLSDVKQQHCIPLPTGC